jgi:FixJ family two-component response regulator
MKEQPVVIVDDDVSVRRGLERLLRSAGYRVESFSSASDFLARDDSFVPLCLLLDVSMPGQSGPRLHDDLLARGYDIPVIFITGHGDTAMTDHAAKAGTYDFLTKPFEAAVLFRAIERATAKAGSAPRS